MKIVVNRLNSLLSVAVLGAALCLSCASTPTSDIRVHSAADAKANLAAYKSYAWDLNAGVIQDRTGAWVPKDLDTQSEVQFLIDKKLRDRGLTVAQQSPDLLVSMLIAADVSEVQAMKTKHGDAAAGLDPVGKGALLVELVDNQTGKTVWLGAAEGDVRGSNSVEVSKQRLAYAVDKLFDQLPH
jgi:hypothetical protein